MKRTFIVNPDNPKRDDVLTLAMSVVRGWGGTAVITVSDPQKSRPQEAHYHAIIGDIARSQTLYGKRRDEEFWKRILVDAFRHSTKDDPELAEDWKQVGGVELVPALNHDGFVMMGVQTRSFTKKLANAFIDWLQAFAAGADP